MTDENYRLTGEIDLGDLSRQESIHFTVAGWSRETVDVEMERPDFYVFYGVRRLTVPRALCQRIPVRVR